MVDASNNKGLLLLHTIFTLPHVALILGPRLKIQAPASSRTSWFCGGRGEANGLTEQWLLKLQLRSVTHHSHFTGHAQCPWGEEV